jgi:glycosyltransferase involved in cell wall biosynthesis
MTIQALRLFHARDLADVEILVVDNAGDPALARLCAGTRTRYVQSTEKQGPAAAKNSVLRNARGAWTLCIDSHVLLAPGAISALLAWISEHPESIDLIHGPMLYDGLNSCASAMRPEWGTDGKFGVWWTTNVPPDDDPVREIPMHGCGLFACRTSVWPGFPDAWRGFANEEGYIHERFRRFGGRVLLLPALKWAHLFRQHEHPSPAPVTEEDLKRNFFIAYDDLKWDPAPVIARWGPRGAPPPGALRTRKP